RSPASWRRRRWQTRRPRRNIRRRPAGWEAVVLHAGATRSRTRPRDLTWPASPRNAAAPRDRDQRDHERDLQGDHAVPAELAVVVDRHGGTSRRAEAVLPAECFDVPQRAAGGGRAPVALGRLTPQHQSRALPRRPRPPPAYRADAPPRPALTPPTSARSAARVGFVERRGTSLASAVRTVPGVEIHAVFSYSARPGGDSSRARSSWPASAAGNRGRGACAEAPGPG